MAKGGFTGAVPPRETSPEDYSGVWDIVEQYGEQKAGSWPFQAGDNAPRSLRFNFESQAPADSAWLSKTPAAAGNRKTWTWSGWVKRATGRGSEGIFAAGVSNSAVNALYFGYNSSDTIALFYYANAVVYHVETTAVFRDPSAWYHVVVAFDTTQATASDRIKIYVNGVRQTSFSTTNYPSQNSDGYINSTDAHAVGAAYALPATIFSGLLAEINFIDGQALSPQEFGFFDGQGIWQPKRFTGDYSSGPVYSNFITASNGGFNAAPYNQPAGFNGVIGTGSGGYVQATSGSNPNNLTFTPSSGIPYTNSVEVYIINAANTVTVNGGTAQTISANQWVTVASGPGVLTSLKFERASTSGASFSGIKIDGQLLTDASVGRNSFHLDFADNNSAAALGTDTSGVGNDWTVNNLSVATGGPTSVAAASGALPIHNTTDTYGTVKGTGTRTDANASSLVLAIPMDGANNGTTFTDESATIRGSGSAQSISVVGNTKTVTSEFQFYGSSAAFDNSGDYLTLPDTSALHLNGAECTIEGWFYTNDAPGAGGGNAVPFFAQADVNASSTSSTANFWSFADTNLWYFGSSTGYMTISSSNVPVGSWFHFACVVTSTTQAKMFVNGELKGEGTIGAIGSGTSRTTNLGVITSGASAKSYLNGYIQDFRMYSVAKYTSSFSPPSSTQNATVAAGNDSLVDSPVNGNEASTGAGGERRGNYATLNPLSITYGSGTLANGNLELTPAGSNWTNVNSTFAITSEKVYFEATGTDTPSSSRSDGARGAWIGLRRIKSQSNWAQNGTDAYSLILNDMGYLRNGGSGFDAIGAKISSGDVVGFAYDGTNGTYEIFFNGVSKSSGSVSTTSYSAGDEMYVATAAYPDGGGYVYGNFALNFGQRPFKYQNAGTNRPSADYKPLATSFLPEPTIKRGDEAMDVVLYTGNGTAGQSITGLDFSPDFVWLKNRSEGYSHTLYDTVRGAGANKALFSNATYGEGQSPGSDDATYGYVSSLDSAGFSVVKGSDSISYTNGSGRTYVGWAWDAGDATTTIAAGSLNSSAYDQSQTWTNFGSGDAASPYRWEETFDGSDSTYGAIAPQGSALSLDLTSLSGGGLSYSSSVVITYNRNTAAPDLTVNGVAVGATADGTDRTHTISGSGLLTNIGGQTRTTAGSGDMGIKKIVVDGRQLVDSSATPPNVPSIATTVRARPEAGFSIATYTSPNSSSDQNFGHGLNAKPDFAIIKNRDTSYNWDIYHSSLGYNSSLIFTSAGTRSGAFSAEPTSFVVNTKTNYTHNGTDDYSALCWTAVEGYSAFGSYTGNGSADGPFVFTGFRVAWLLLKRTDSSGDWFVLDSERNLFNPTDNYLRPNVANSELDNTEFVDLLSNGFKIKATGNAYNGSGATVVYAAFASHPFASNARAC
nr:fiber protein [uncultured Mediterranean phage uvMED]